MEYIPITGTRYEIKVEKIGEKYSYLLRAEGEEAYNIGTSTKTPLELTKQSEIGKAIYTPLRNKGYTAVNDDERNRKRDKDFRYILGRLDNELKNDELREAEEQQEAEAEQTEKYIEAYSRFVTKREEYGYTTLQYLGQICQGAGVGLAENVLKVYVSLLLTVLGVKATNIIAIGKQSSGKALSLDTRIPTPYGYTTMGEVKVGDRLFDENGKICTVTYKSPVFKDHDCYRVVFDDGTKIIADADHIWNVSTLHTRRTNKPNINITTKEIYDKGLMRKNGKTRTYDFQLPTTKPIICNEKKLPIDPYLFGLWLGDGDTDNSVITISEKKEQLKKSFESNGYGLKHISRDDISYYIQDGFRTLLAKNNLLGNKHIPQEYLRASVEQRKSLLQGLMDTDGYVDINGNCEMVQKSLQLIKDIKELLGTLGIKSKITETWKSATNGSEKKRKYYRLFFTTTMDVFTIPYKKERLPNKVKPSTRTRKIIEISKTDTVPTQCIQVDSLNHLYCIDNFIPTHNTHSLERGIEMIPSEYVVRGVHTKAYFFTKFNGQDVSRKVFYLGDLGGIKDDQNTIDTRDILKELNTDGYVERGISIDGEAHDEWVKGYPAIVYSTVEEDIVNDQEKSRSTIITPQSVDQDKLTLFNSVHESPGEDIRLLERIDDDVKSVQGLTWYLMENIKEYELFNPYMFNVSEFLAEMEDFNRKIKEFDKTLFIVSLLNNPFVLEHQIYHDKETYEPITTKLIIASKQDVLNALAIFDGANNLLPTETALLKGLNKVYRECGIPYEKDMSVSEYEKIVREDGEDDLFRVNEDGSISGWEHQYVEDEKEAHYFFFTVSSIRRAYASQLWYRNVKNKLSQKLRKLYENKYLIRIGKSTNNENIYGLAPNLTEKIENNIPSFGGERLQKGKSEFKRKYPKLYDDFEEFINKDRMRRCSKVDFEINESTLYNVPWDIKF